MRNVRALAGASAGNGPLRSGRADEPLHAFAQVDEVEDVDLVAERAKTEFAPVSAQGLMSRRTGIGFSQARFHRAQGGQGAMPVGEGAGG
jgi:hypothetical protein